MSLELGIRGAKSAPLSHIAVRFFQWFPKWAVPPLGGGKRATGWHSEQLLNFFCLQNLTMLKCILH